MTDLRPKQVLMKCKQCQYEWPSYRGMMVRMAADVRKLLIPAASGAGRSCDCLGYKERGMVNPNCIEHSIIPDAVDAIRSRIQELKEQNAS